MLVLTSSKWQESCSELRVTVEGEHRPEKEGKRDKRSKLVGCMKGVEGQRMGDRDRESKVERVDRRTDTVAHQKE
jgi:hypothetical protein